jgi:hypothetical protein
MLNTLGCCQDVLHGDRGGLARGEVKQGNGQIDGGSAGDDGLFDAVRDGDRCHHTCLLQAKRPPEGPVEVYHSVDYAVTVAALGSVRSAACRARICL